VRYEQWGISSFAHSQASGATRRWVKQSRAYIFLRRSQYSVNHRGMIVLCVVASRLLHLHRIASHTIASHRIPSHRIAYHRIASHTIASHRIPSHRIASHRIPSHRIASHRIASHRIAYHRIASHPIASHRIASHRIASRQGSSVFRFLVCPHNTAVRYVVCPHLPPSHISHPFVSCTVDSRYHKNSMIIILLNNHQRDEFGVVWRYQSGFDGWY